MRKRLLIAIGATAALVVAATAYAAFTASGISTTTATLTTTTADNVKTRQCTGGDGKAFTITDASFTGAADFTVRQPSLDGPATFHVKTTVDDASHLGYVEGSFKVKDADTDCTAASPARSTRTGKFAGFLTATPTRQQGEDPRHAERHVRGRHGLCDSGRRARNRAGRRLRSRSSPARSARRRRSRSRRSRTRRPRTTSGSTSTARSR